MLRTENIHELCKWKTKHRQRSENMHELCKWKTRQRLRNENMDELCKREPRHSLETENKHELCKWKSAQKLRSENMHELCKWKTAQRLRSENMQELGTMKNEELDWKTAYLDLRASPFGDLRLAHVADAGRHAQSLLSQALQERQGTWKSNEKIRRTSAWKDNGPSSLRDHNLTTKRNKEQLKDQDWNWTLNALMITKMCARWN